MSSQTAAYNWHDNVALAVVAAELTLRLAVAAYAVGDGVGI